MRMFILRYALISIFMILTKVVAATASPSDHQMCSVGVFGGPDDKFIVVTETEDGYEYAFDTGVVGQIFAPDARVLCLEDALEVRGQGVWPRVALRETETVFQSEGVTLTGRLIEAPHTDGPVPLVVFAHGSERTGWLDRVRDPYMLVGRGVSVFVYDKRGTGRSGGQYNQNFSRLANDLVAASEQAKSLANGRFTRFGLIGLSQGGWVVPLAANRAKADFIGVGYGLVMDIREEDAAQVEIELREAGYGEDVLELAREITNATARIATDPSVQAVTAFDEVRRQFADEPWLDVVRGDYTGILLDASRDEIETQIIPEFESYDVDWSLDPVTVVREVQVPQLWIFAGEDRAAPIDISIERLTALRESGKEISIRVFPDTDHGMWEFSEDPRGDRNYTRITSGYYDMLADWAFGDLHGQYGKSGRR